MDLAAGTVTIRSLKTRKDTAGRQKGIHRSVPVPPDHLGTMGAAHDLRKARASRKRAAAPIFPLTRTRVWQIVVRVMIEADLPGAPQRSPEGLRHGFDAHAAVSGVPLDMLRKWLGHAQLSTIAIHADAVGKEEDLARERVRRRFPDASGVVDEFLAERRAEAAREGDAAADDAAT